MRVSKRRVYCGQGSVYLFRWLAARGDWPGALLTPIRRDGSAVVKTNKTMHANTLVSRLAKLSELAGVETFSPHDLRRSFVGQLLENGADISTVQQLAGHAQVVTTQRYDRRPEAAKKRVADLLSVPA